MRGMCLCLASLLVATLPACSPNASPQVPPVYPNPVATAAVVLPTRSSSPPREEARVADSRVVTRPSTDANPESDTTLVKKQADISELFAPPKVVVPPPLPKQEIAPVVPAEQPEPQPEEPLPPLRLVGFAMADDQKAILSVAGKLSVLAVGESSHNVEVVAIAPPVVTLKHRDKELQIDLMQQPWSELPADPAKSPRASVRRPGISAPVRRSSPAVPAVPSEPAPLRSPANSSTPTRPVSADAKPPGLPVVKLPAAPR
ncbi:MAG: hypothetical protein AB7O38_30450 [Pirellulaceae bacterium]